MAASSAKSEAAEREWPSVTVEIPGEIWEAAGILVAAETGRVPSTSGDYNKMRDAVLSVLTVSVAKFTANSVGGKFLKELAAFDDGAEKEQRIREGAVATVRAEKERRDLKAKADAEKKAKGGKRATPKTLKDRAAAI